MSGISDEVDTSCQPKQVLKGPSGFCYQKKRLPPEGTVRVHGWLNSISSILP